MILTPWATSPAHHHDPLGPYLETAWLPIIGPTASWLYRRLVAETPGTVDLDEIAWSLGLQSRADRVNAPVNRALHRLAHFGLVRVDGDTVAVRLSLPPLTRRQLDRLHPAVARRVLDQGVPA